MANKGLKPLNTLPPEVAHEIHVKGGKARQVQRKKRKEIREDLKAYLEGRVPGTDLNEQQMMVASVIRNVNEEGRPQDLKVLAEILGELTEKADVTVDFKGLRFVVPGKDANAWEDIKGE